MYCKLALAFALLIWVRGMPAWAEDLAGKVLQDHSGAPVASADVHVYKIGVRELAADLETDGEGRFQASGLGPGDYRLEVEKPSYINTTSMFKIAAGSAAGLTVRLVRCGSISGRVTVAGAKPPSGAIVVLLTKTSSGLRPAPRVSGSYSTLGDNGQYRLFNLAPGEYAVAVSYGAHTSAVSSTGIVPPATAAGSGYSIYPTNSHPEFFTISGGDDVRGVDFNILTGTLFSVSGKVEIPAPKTSFWVTLTPVDQPALAVAVTPAGDDGSFRFAGIPVGSYYVFTSGPIHARGFMGAIADKDPLFARRRIEVTQDIAGFMLSPQKGFSAEVGVKPEPGAEDACPSKATVIAMGLEDLGALLQQSAPASREKQAVFTNLAPAKYQLTATGLGDSCYQTGETILDLSNGAAGLAVISIAGAGSIHGRVSLAKNDAMTVVLLDVQTAAIRNAVTDSDGRFKFAGLKPGRYRVAAHRTAEPASKRWMAAKDMLEIEVVPGKPMVLDLAAPAPVNP